MSELVGLEIFVEWVLITMLLTTVVWFLVIAPITKLLCLREIISDTGRDDTRVGVMFICAIVMMVVAGTQITYPTHRQSAVLTAEGRLIRLPYGGIDRLLPEGEITRIKEEIPCLTATGRLPARLAGIEAYMEIDSPVFVELLVKDPDTLYRVRKDEASSGFTGLCLQIRSAILEEVLPKVQNACSWSNTGKIRTAEKDVPIYRKLLADQIRARLEREFGGQGVEFSVELSGS